jgi:hypothetical protein
MIARRVLPVQHSTAGMHAGEPEAPLVGEERGEGVTGFVSRRWCATLGSCSCLGVSRRLPGAARTFALKGSLPKLDRMIVMIETRILPTIGFALRS